MTDQVSAPRSRRALLTAAAGGAAALAASAALPLSVAAADPDDVVKGVDNATDATTSITNSTADSTAFATSAQGTGYGVEGTSSGGAGIFAWSVAEPDFWDVADGAYTGVYGWSPGTGNPAFVGVGVWGDSDDFGVYGSGGVGVYGAGGNGVVGESFSSGAGVVALGQSASSLALDVYGKVRFSRSGRTKVRKGNSTRSVTLAGVTANSHVFAMVHYNSASRWVRAVVPHAGSFRIYLNGKVAASTTVAWFVLN